MEVTKEVLIDGNLIEKSTIKVYYKGRFTREFSNEVFIVYGYGLGWKNIKKQKMTWSENCFFAEINLEYSGELNFCFKNDYGSWDNNNGKDYVVKIEPDISFEDKVINEEIEIAEEKNQEEVENITTENIQENKQEVASEEVKQENFYIDGRIFNAIKVENNNEDEKTIKDISKRYSKESKQEKFKRAVDKKEKKSRRQKKIEKNRSTIKSIQSISNEEESLFEYANNEKKIDKVSDVAIDKIVTNELKNNKPKKKRKTKKERSKANLRRYKRNKVRNIIRIISLVALTAMIIYLIVYFLEKKDMENQTSNLLNSVEIDKSGIENIEFEETERMLQVRELNLQYQDLKGWIEIEGTNINYPLMQGTDNDYYMNHDYKKEYSRWGSLFLDKAYDWTIPSSNLLIYGHNFSDGVMLSDLLKYADKSFYDAHPTIKVTTPEEDVEYEIIAVFYSRLYYKSEKNVFRYYFFVNAEDEEAYNEFVNNAKAASIYDTGKTAEYGEQLLTLSTCEYSQEDGRFAVVARKVK